MVKRRLNEDISPAEKMIVHKFYDDIIERNEKILKIFKKIKFDDKEELFTYESSSLLCQSSLKDCIMRIMYLIKEWVKL